MERITTGSNALDEILGGGLPEGSLVVLGGGPGTGKTILAQQICFSNARPEAKGVYYTTLSEPHSKLVEHLAPFEFFDPGALGHSVEFLHIGGLVDRGGLEAWSEELVRKAFDEHPSVIVVDSSKALHAFSSGEFRSIVYELASRIAHSKAVLVFVGEYEAADVAINPEFAVADLIMLLNNEPSGVADRRWLRVTKVRGSDYRSGRHSFRLGSKGFEVFPRFEGTPSSRIHVLDGRKSIGVPGLDEMMGGGIPIGNQTLLAGPSGSGKTVVALSFVAEGIRNREKCLYVSFQEAAPQLLSKARAFGWDFEPAIAEGLLEIRHVEPVEVGLDMLGSTLKAAIEKGPVQRIALDSIAELDHAARGTDRFEDYVWSLVEVFRSVGATGLLTSETEAFFGPRFQLARGLSFVIDNVVLLRYTELESEIRRALGVVKMRDSDHVKSLVEFDITPKGVQVLGKFQGVRGVLSGTPERTEEKFREFFDR